MDEIAHWFQRWFDPQGERQDPGAELSHVIHSLNVGPSSLSIDFGTAATDAFWEMLALLEDAGARDIRISASSFEAAAEG